MQSLLVLLAVLGLAVGLDRERDCRCRVRGRPRIRGGRPLDAGLAYPWMVSLGENLDGDRQPSACKVCIQNESETS